MCSNESEDSLQSETLYCICRKKSSDFSDDDFMIECDLCKDWMHGSCINLNQIDSKSIDRYVCPVCTNSENQTIYKIRNNFHRHDFFDEEADKKPIQAGTPVFIDNLVKKKFDDSDEILMKLNGSDLNVEYFEEKGFKRPMFFEKIDGLDFKVPSGFSLKELEQLLGSDYNLEVIDVEKQQTIPMNVNALKNYFELESRNRIYNLISLEISKTKLNEFVELPKIIRDISWASCGILPKDCSYFKSSNEPDVQKYCLVSAKDSYTDFHVDFGGSSVWYHVLKGAKVFYLIEPTETNLTLYEKWAGTPNNTEIIFSDQVEKCYSCELKEGHTIFLPTGYIHAVYTPLDSIVFGGNFLNSYNIPLQIKIYEMENRLQVLQKFRFPQFRLLNWYAARFFTKYLKCLNRRNIPVKDYLYFGCEELRDAIKKWHFNKNNKNEDLNEFPNEDIDCGVLVRVFSRELKKSKALLRKTIYIDTHNSNIDMKPKRVKNEII